MRILGIDPGYALTGYALLDASDRHEVEVVDYGMITTKAKTYFPNRLLTMFEAVHSLCDRFEPDVAAIEQLFFASNAKTAIGAAEARGAMIAALASRNIPVFEYTPNQVKLAVTGYGHAKKGQIQAMVTKLLNLPEVPQPDDIADAIAIALCHAQTGNREEFLAQSGYFNQEYKTMNERE